MAREQLIALGRYLLTYESNTHYTIIDDTSELEMYREWSRTQFATKWPKEWVDKHLLARVKRDNRHDYIESGATTNFWSSDL